MTGSDGISGLNVDGTVVAIVGLVLLKCLVLESKELPGLMLKVLSGNLEMIDEFFVIQKVLIHIRKYPCIHIVYTGRESMEFWWKGCTVICMPLRDYYLKPLFPREHKWNIRRTMSPSCKPAELVTVVETYNLD